MNKRKVGTTYEQKAAEYLTEKEYQILETNYRNRYGEIDLVARDRRAAGRPIVFVEVKYRRNASYGVPQEAVNGRKQRKIISVAWFYLKMHGCGYDTPCRFDVITICGDHSEHIENAFYGAMI